MVLISFFMIGFLQEFNESVLRWVSRKWLKRILKRVQHEQTDATTSDIRIPKLSSLCWKQFDKSPSSRQRKFLNPYLQTREPISSYYDIQKGDHLVRTSSTMMGLLKFEHHFLCIGHNERGAPLIVHYNATKKDAFRRFFIWSLTHSSLARVNIMALPDYINEDNLQKQGVEVKRVLWPDGLRRYSVEKITWRALKRLGEAYYHVRDNNCESFVMWCICNSNVSLQATPENISALNFVPELSSEEVQGDDFEMFKFLYIIYMNEGLFDRSLDSFHALTVELPKLYAVAALYLTLYFWAKKFNIERGKYLHSTWGNPIEYEKKLQENVENVVLKAAATVATFTLMSIFRPHQGGIKVYHSILLSVCIGQVSGHLVGRLTYHLRQYFLA